MKKKIFATISFLFFFIALVFSQQQSSLREKVGTGYIDWKEGKIKMRGQGAAPLDASSAGQARLMAERAAKMEAIANFLEVVKGVRIDSETTVSDLGTESKIIRRVEGYVKNFAVAKVGYLSDATVYVDVVFDLYGENGLFSAIFDEYETQIEGKLYQEIKELKEVIYLLEKRIEKLEKKEEKKEGIKKVSVSKKYTGLIIDARDIPFRCALMPKIFSDDGREIYSQQNINTDIARKIGAVSYSSSLNEARENIERIGDNPLVIKAQSLLKDNKSDLLISSDDADKILQNKSLYQNCAVIIVVN